MGQLIVVTGPPGAGKSTVAARLVLEYEPSALVAGDGFFAFLARGAIAPWRPEAQAQNTAVIEAASGRLAAAFTVVYDGVLGPWFLPVFAGAAGGVRLHYLVLLPPLEQCLNRVSTRLGHGFTDLSAAEHMYREFEHAPLDRRHVVTDLPDDAGASAARLRELVDTGSLVVETSGGPVSR